MQVVGIDLGTTNLRISTWDRDQPDRIPQPLTIGQGDSYTMPTVIAFRRQPGGEIETIVGEAADNLEDGPNQVVVRNAKRYALAHDPYVRWHLEVREIEWPSWWNQEARCVQVWGQDFPVKDLISLMLKEAFQRAGLGIGFEWRAGCPVHAGFTYRSELSQAITESGGTGRGEVSWVIEEPLLLLALADRLGALTAGESYLVYDLGGGSFDCALAQIRDANTSGLAGQVEYLSHIPAERETGFVLGEPIDQFRVQAHETTLDAKRMIIFGADGNPTIGGSDIDDILAADLEYNDNPNLLRLAKEVVSSSNPQNLPGGKTLTWQDYEKAVKKGQFITKTFTAMRDSYVGAKVLWGRGDDAPPVGEIIQRNPDTGEVSFVWQLGWENLAADVDKIILCGGPTKSPIFLENLKARFGATRIISTSELIPPEIPDPELTAISAGACYASTGEYIPLYVNRLPVQITLEDLHTGAKVEYQPYEHFTESSKKPFNAFLSQDFLQENPDDPHSDSRYELTVATPDNVLLPTTGRDGVVRERQPVDPYINTRLVGSTLHLVIDRVGQVAVMQESETSTAKAYVIIENPPWQVGKPAQPDIEALMKAQREYERNEQASAGSGITLVSRIDPDTGGYTPLQRA